MEAQCIGRAALDMVFGTPDNYRIESLSYDVVPFWSCYHTLLGWTAFARFHVVLHYAYMKLKMSGPKSVITICDNLDRLLRTEEQSTTFGTKALAAEELSEMRTKVDEDDFILSKCSKSTSLKTDGDIIKIQVHHVDSSMTTLIGSALDPK